MIDLNRLARKILKNKKKKGFPIGNFEYDFNKIIQEVAESIDAERKRDPELAFELADIIILVLGVAVQKKINIESALLQKFKIITKRKIKKVGSHFVKS